MLQNVFRLQNESLELVLKSGTWTRLRVICVLGLSWPHDYMSAFSLRTGYIADDKPSEARESEVKRKLVQNFLAGVRN